ncbi:site-specific integrase [Paenibacillus sp. 7124]|uniref:Site-specific integrase n=2 Tax=Paenibacillus apii TaxID=1850370 RepID=A0A6M1PJJ5_9BACL|nr:site-specific integrase [Paenibacillus apii]
MTVAGYVGKYFVKKENKELWFYTLTLGKDANGKRIQKKKRGFKNEREAKKALRDAQVQADKGSYYEPSKMTYGEFLKEWFRGKSANYSDQTTKSTESYIRLHIMPQLGQYPLSKLNVLIIERFMNDLRAKGLAEGTIKRIYNVVTASLNSAERKDIIPRNVATRIDNKPKGGKKDMEVWTAEEVKLFLNTVRREEVRYYEAFHLALATGMRQGEILGLRWRDVDLERGIVSVRQTLSHDGKTLRPGAKTTTSVRTISIDPDTVSMLDKWRRRQQLEKSYAGAMYEDNDLVVCTTVGTPTTPRNLSRTWYSMLKKSELHPITFHDLRHTHASLLLKNNVHPKIVSERLGHASIQITLDLYSHLFPNMQEEAAHALGEQLFRT